LFISGCVDAPQAKFTRRLNSSKTWALNWGVSRSGKAAGGLGQVADHARSMGLSRTLRHGPTPTPDTGVAKYNYNRSIRRRQMARSIPSCKPGSRERRTEPAPAAAEVIASVRMLKSRIRIRASIEHDDNQASIGLIQTVRQ
jgi:hypothetical protein